MAISIVGSNKFTPTTTSTTRSLPIPSGAQAGDSVLFMVVQAGGSTTTTPSGLAGLVQVGTQNFSGHKTYVFMRSGLTADELGATVLFTSSSALRITVLGILIRGVDEANPIDVMASLNGPTGASTDITTPPVTVVTADAVELQLVGMSGTAGTNSITAGFLTQIVESFDAGTAGGVTHGVAAWDPTPVAAGKQVGGTVWVANTAKLMSAYTIVLKPRTFPTTTRPSSTSNATGFNPVNIATLHEALADENAATYAESVDNPAGSTFTVKLGPLSNGQITVSATNSASAASPVISRKMEVLQGTTVAATRTIDLPTQPTEWKWSLTEAELMKITDRSNLFVRVTDTVK